MICFDIVADNHASNRNRAGVPAILITTFAMCLWRSPYQSKLDFTLALCFSRRYAMVVLRQINDDWMELVVNGEVRDQGHPPFTLDRLQRRLADLPDLKLAEIAHEEAFECYGCTQQFTSIHALDREGLCATCRRS